MNDRENRLAARTMWTAWDENLRALLPYEIAILALAATRLRLRTILAAHALFLVSLLLLVALFDLDGSFGGCLVSRLDPRACLRASSRRSWFEPIWVGTIWAIVAMVLWLPCLG